MDWGAIIPSFLGGALITAIGFQFRQNGHFTEMATTLKALVQNSDDLKAKLEKHIEQPPTCSEHNGICADVQVLKIRVDKLEKTIDK
jgi:hypothetical protein